MLKRILFVDDEPRVLEGLQLTLRPRAKPSTRYGYVCTQSTGCGRYLRYSWAGRSGGLAVKCCSIQANFPR
jgi:hypothetical protein